MELETEEVDQHSGSVRNQASLDTLEQDEQMDPKSSYPTKDFDDEDYRQSSATAYHDVEFDSDDFYQQGSGYANRYTEFDSDTYTGYTHRHTYGLDNLSRDSTDDEDQQQSENCAYNMDGTQGRYYSYGNSLDSEGAYPRLVQTQISQSSEEDDMKEASAKLVDPGAFRYNKRVFITALPCLLVLFVMTGEILLLMVTIGSMMIALMVHSGEDVAKRCVVVFALLFIPCHILVVGTVLPFLWLSLWNILLVVLVNLFCILTGGWIIIQFVAFRMEEAALCATIERMLFSSYPFVCSALVTWVLSTVVPVSAVPFIFLCIWFVCLQLYLVPAASSFKVPDREDEDILNQSNILVIVATFVISGPALRIALHLARTSSASFWTLPSLALLGMLLCVGLFLFTLLNVRQLCEHLGISHLRMVQVRWVSGAAVLLLCYPVLQEVRTMSHLLLSLGVAVAGFSALGLTLSLKAGKGLSLLLMAALMLLLCLWLSHLPWTLTYYFWGFLPLRSFYGVVAANFGLCVVAIYTASSSHFTPIFGALLLLQSVGLTVCEMGLYQRGLYSLPTLQLTGVLATYTLHRLYLANKLTRLVAVLTSAIQLSKTAVGTLQYVVVTQALKDQDQQVVDVPVLQYLSLLSFLATLLWLFVYDTTEQLTLSLAVRQLTALLVSLGVSCPSFLVPLSTFLTQDDPMLADLVGLWYGVGGVLVLLYALQHRQTGDSLVEQLIKLSVVSVGVGFLVTVMQPRFALTLHAVYQWSEVCSLLLVAALLATDLELTFSHILATAAVLGICPGVHVTLLIYEDMGTVMHFILISAISCVFLAFLLILLKLHKVSEDAQDFIKIGTLLISALLLGVLCVDLINFEPMTSVWDYPVWTVALLTTASISLCLKVAVSKLGHQQLPLVRPHEGGLALVPVMGNVATILAFLLACTRGPYDALLQDLWCCGATVLLVLLQPDPLLLTSLSPGNRATPMVLTSVGVLVVSTLVRSQLWELDGVGGVLLGAGEVVVVMCSLPVYAVLAGILWRGEIWSEKAVVFTLPLNLLLLLLGSSYTAWVLCAAGLLCGAGMMMFKLPLLPYNFELMQR